MLTVEAAEEIASRHPQAETAWLENSGHTGYMEEPERTAEIIADFIDRHSGSA